MLKLVSYQKKAAKSLNPEYKSLESYEHHWQLINGYMDSHRVRNHSSRTIARDRTFLEGWFLSHGNTYRPLYIWEDMEPVVGRKRIVDYGQALLDSELTNSTIRSYLGRLRSFFSYVLEHPFVFSKDQKPFRIHDYYNRIEQPVSEFDYPQHSYDGVLKGLPMDPEDLYKLYSIWRKEYLCKGAYSHIRARNYTMAVLAGETGLRSDELIHLEITRDIFFKSRKIQTRYAKGTRGSGKRLRMTLFPPLSRATVRFYLSKHRKHIKNSKKTDYLFPSKTGKLMSYSSMQQSLKKMIKVANNDGLPVCSTMGWHNFRRIFATLFIERYPDKMPVLIQLLGHMSPNTVHCYITHSSAWMDRKVQEVLELKG